VFLTIKRIILSILTGTPDGYACFLIKSLLLKVRLFLLIVFSESFFYSCLAHSPDALNELRMLRKKSTRSIKWTVSGKI
jgi:hypothetical protein